MCLNQTEVQCLAFLHDPASTYFSVRCHEARAEISLIAARISDSTGQCCPRGAAVILLH